MNEPCKKIAESTAQNQALAYYADKIDARVAEMANNDLPEWTYKNEDLWVRNFACQRSNPFVMFGKTTRFPDMLKLPEFRQAVAAEASRAFRSYGVEVDSYIRANRRLKQYQDNTKVVGSGYELRVKITALPATAENLFGEVHGAES